MKKVAAFLFLISTMCISAFAQLLLTEFDKAREIKMLESNRNDVKKILSDYERDESDNESAHQYFSTKNTEIEITFSNEDCSVNSTFWNVPEWVVTKVEITPKDTIEIKDLKFDFSKYKKEIEDEDSPGTYKYLDEDAGIVFGIYEKELQKIILYPPKSKISFLCNNESTSGVISGEKRPVDLIMYETTCHLTNTPAFVENLILSKDEIISCSKKETNKRCSNNNAKIFVTTEAIDSENDVLLYDYTISGGKIVGAGKKVIWDLSGVKPGAYKIIAAVDDGTGISGKTKTKEVIVKANASIVK